MKLPHTEKKKKKSQASKSQRYEEIRNTHLGISSNYQTRMKKRKVNYQKNHNKAHKNYKVLLKKKKKTSTVGENLKTQRE